MTPSGRRPLSAWRQAALAAALVASLAACIPPEGFNFARYEFGPTDAYGEIDNAAAEAGAQAFLTQGHLDGSPLPAAEADVRRAGALCSKVRDPAETHVRCVYGRPAHGLSGLVGSSVWRIDLYAVADRLTRLTVRRELDAT